MYKLCSWVDADKINWKQLSSNPNAIQLLEQNIEKVDVETLLYNRNIDIMHILKLKYKTHDKYPISRMGHMESVDAVKILSANVNKILWEAFASNSLDCAIDLMEKHTDKINWGCCFERNTNIRMLNIIKSQSLNVYWKRVSKHITSIEYVNFIKENDIPIEVLSQSPNHSAIELLKQHPDKIDWQLFSANSSDYAIEFLNQNLDKVDWCALSSNTNDNAIALLNNNQDEIAWCRLCENRNNNAIKILEQNLDKIIWHILSQNSCDAAVDLLYKNQDRIHWGWLCGNKNNRIIKLLEQNQNKIEWIIMSGNPNIFTYDYCRMKKIRSKLTKELMETMFHPRNIRKWKSWGFDEGL